MPQKKTKIAKRGETRSAHINYATLSGMADFPKTKGTPQIVAKAVIFGEEGITIWLERKTKQ